MEDELHPSDRVPEGYDYVLAPCGIKVFGTPNDIDSGYRHHVYMCDECLEIIDEDEL